MTKFKQAVNIIANEYLQDEEEIARIQPDTISDIFKCYMYDSDDLRDEFTSILNEARFTDFDELNIDGHNFRQLAIAVRRVRI